MRILLTSWSAKITPTVGSMRHISHIKLKCVERLICHLEKPLNLQDSHFNSHAICSRHKNSAQKGTNNPPPQGTL